MGKNIIIFDFDSTLAVSKTAMDAEMAELINELLKKKKVAVMSGGKYGIFQKLLIESLISPPELLQNLFLFPTCGAQFYKYNASDWKNVYMNELSDEEKEKITKAFWEALEEYGYQKPEQPYGEIIEDRVCQITFSGLGQKTPVDIKSKWDPDMKKRNGIAEILRPKLPDFHVKVAGMSSIDVTMQGIDKAYGIKKIEEYLGFTKEQMLFVGDMLQPGGNDYPVKAAGVDCIEVENPEDTKKVIRQLLNESE